MAGTTRGRVLTISGGIGILALAGIYFFARPRYAFLRHFKTDPRDSEWARTDGSFGPDVRCYGFSAPAPQVMGEVRNDLVADGWGLDYHDPSLLIFEREEAGRKERAIFAARTADWMSWSEPASTTSLLWMSYRPGWLETQLAALEKRLGIGGPAAGIDVQPYTSMPYAFVEAGPEAGVIWRNFYRRPMKIRVDSIQAKGYDTLKQLPETIAIPPRSGIEETFGFPAQAGARLQGTENIEIDVLEPAVGPLRHWSMTAEPDLSAGSSGDGAFVNIVNNQPRVFEIKNLTIESGGKAQKSRHGIVELRPGTSLSVQMKTGEEDEPSISYDYRLTPNKRWRHFSYGDE
ncbi:MAG TPA: hypothetical protein VMI31_06355 [Fimbriimonadaceae bacterium]|nr:hypothetical protein [Fimbriimonadaceae bacterium]